MTLTPTFTTAQLSRRITTIHNRVLQNYEHITAFDCIKHAYVFDDITLFTRLCNVMLGPSGRKQGGKHMIAWGKDNFPIVTKFTDDKKSVKITLRKGRSNSDWDFKNAGEHHYDEASKKEIASVVLGLDEVLKLLTRTKNNDNITPEARTMVVHFEEEVTAALGRPPQANVA